MHTSGNRELIPPRKEAGPPWTSLVHDWMGLIQRSCSLLSPLGWVVRTILRTRSQHHPPAGCHVVQKGAPKANLGVARRGGGCLHTTLSLQSAGYPRQRMKTRSICPWCPGQWGHSAQRRATFSIPITRPLQRLLSGGPGRLLLVRGSTGRKEMTSCGWERRVVPFHFRCPHGSQCNLERT